MEDLFKTITTGNDEDKSKALQSFVETATQTFCFPELSVKDLRKNVWESLLNIAKSTKNKTDIMNCFIAIRILSREKAELNELASDDWFELIKIHSGLNNSDYQFTSDNIPVAIEAQKSLCNMIFNSKVAAALCCKNGILEHLTERLKLSDENKIPEEVKFFDVKHIFLLTALCPEIRNRVRIELKGVASLIKYLDLMLKKAAESKTTELIILDDEKVDLVCEALKALFNLTLNCYGNNADKEEDEQCRHLVVLLRMYLLIPTNNKEKEHLLKNNVVNLLTNIPNDYFEFLMTPIQEGQNVPKKFKFEDQNMTAIYEMLMFFKEKLAGDTGVSKQCETLLPIITVLVKCANSQRPIRKYLRYQILPPLKDVHTRPEEGSTLRNYLCRLLTTPITQIRDLVAELLFVLCKKSVKRMIKYTGYGNAAGLFAQRGLLGGKSDAGEADYSSESEDSETEEYAEFKHGINPVLGCYEAPHPNPMENMTEEQKEYEAMKLVELMDNLTKCGAIQPCRVGADGKPHPIEHVLQLQEGLRAQQIDNESDSD